MSASAAADQMNIVKSSRHQKIIGNLGEVLLCNWFSRSGFEVSLVDHTGLDVVAFNPKTRQRLGVSVKSRTRTRGTENSAVNIFSYQKGKNDRERLLNACEAFACEPWIALYVETLDSADLYLLSLEHYDRRYRGARDRAIDAWKMGHKYRREYEIDPDVHHIRMEFSSTSWKWS